MLDAPNANVTKIEPEYKIIYRSVSQEELNDISINGLRTNENVSYSTEKLFAPTIDEAGKFGRINYHFDLKPSYMIEVKTPINIYNEAFKFSPDGMNAISIPADKLQYLHAKPINYNPNVRIPF